MKTCSVTSLTDLGMLEGFEQGSCVDGPIVCGVWFFFFLFLNSAVFLHSLLG